MAERSATAAPLSMLQASFAIALTCTLGCEAKGPEQPASQPARVGGADGRGAQKGPERPGPDTKGALPAAAPASHADYVADPPSVPARLGARRIFLRLPKVSWLRDPTFVPGTQDVVVVAKIGGMDAIWRMGVSGNEAAKMVVAKPILNKRAKRTAQNRNDWYIGTPSVFPDGEHIVFDGSSPNANSRFPNVLGLVSMKDGLLHAVEVKGVETVRTPGVHPDGKGVVFAACDELRSITLKGYGDQVVSSTVLLKLPRRGTDHKNACTVHRPRWSPDGKHLLFEVIGHHLTAEAQKQYNVPERKGPSDFMIEVWIADGDGKNPRRLLSDAAYQAIGGREQAGGTKDPAWSPDSQRVVFSHGKAIAVTDITGKSARIVVPHTVQGTGDTHTSLFSEADPAWSSDGKTIVAGSRLAEKEGKTIPPGLVVIDVATVDAAPAPKANR